MDYPNTTVWRCLVCGYEHEGARPPDVCPVCGVGPEMFERVPAAGAVVPPSPLDAEPAREPHATTEPQVAGEPGPASGSAAPRVLIVGAGIAGLCAAAAAREHNACATVTLIGAENERPYYRLNLTRVLAGQTSTLALPMREETWFAAQRIGYEIGEATRLERESHRVHLRDGRILPYDKLVLALGAAPTLPAWASPPLAGVFALRTIADARAVLAWATTHRRAVIVGGGLLGLESAGGLAAQGLRVTVLEHAPSLLPRQLAPAAAQIFADHLAAIGVEVRCAVDVAGVVANAGAVAAVTLAEGAALPADLVLLATGVHPHTTLAREAGLAVQRGVLVDEALCTSDPDIYAAGDVTEHAGVVYGRWPVAEQQGRVAGANAAGAQARFVASRPTTTLKVLDLDLASDLGPLDSAHV